MKHRKNMRLITIKVSEIQVEINRTYENLTYLPLAAKMYLFFFQCYLKKMLLLRFLV